MIEPSSNVPEPKRRRDAGILQVTERDITTLTWISEQFCIAFDHLQLLLGRYAKALTKNPGKLSVSATRDTVSRWLQLGFIEEPRKIVSGHPPYVWLSRKGLSQLGLDYAYYKPQMSSIKHIYAVNAIRLHLERLNISASWYAERTLVKETSIRPVPDAELRFSKSYYVACKIFETPFKYDVSRQDAIEVLEDLAQRYPSLYCFSHMDIISLLEKAFDNRKSLQEHMRFYSLDVQTLPNMIQELGEIATGNDALPA